MFKTVYSTRPEDKNTRSLTRKAKRQEEKEKIERRKKKLFKIGVGMLF